MLGTLLADGLRAGLCGEFFQHAQVDFLEPRLQGRSHVAVALLERFLGLSRGRFQQPG